jgi:hypothetical protein
MKKLAALLSLPVLAWGLNSCTPKEPKLEDYNTGIAPISIMGQPNAYVKDFDKDGLADAIITGSGFAMYYIKGYEKNLNLVKTSTEMTPELRKYASDFIKAENSLKYEAGKMNYGRKKAEYDLNKVKNEASKAKIEVLNKAMEKH